jgi:hypothetical protein
VGFALLLGLSVIAAFAALAVALRAQLRGRIEVLVAATILWNAIIIAPIYVLGLLERLTPLSLAVGSLVTSGTTTLLASRGVRLSALARDVAFTFASFLRLPWDALVLASRPRRFVFVGVAWATVLLPYIGLSAYFAHYLPIWDPLWYHDTIVGFTIQNHGFAMVDLPQTLQKVNGYVRLGEMTQLWLVIFTDRRLADLTNVLFAPAIAGGVYLLVRRYTTQVLAVGWGVAVVLMPACASILQGTFVDPQNAALLLAAVVFATRDEPRLRDGWLAGLALSLTIGSKGLALISVPVVGVIGACLLLRAHWRRDRGAAIGTVVGGVVLIAAMASVTYLRDYWAFHNPFWPDMAVDVPSLGIHWPGEGGWATDPARRGLPVNLNESFPKLMDHLYALPWTVKGMFFDQAVDYGIGITWLVIPLGALAFVTCLYVAIRRRLGHVVPSAPGPFPFAIWIIVAAVVGGSPALWAPRYHIAAVGFVVTLVVWFTSRPGWERIGESTLSTVLVTSLMMFWWTPTTIRWWFTPEQLVKLAAAKPIEREVSRELGAPTLLDVGLAREKELKPGTLLVFNEQYSGYPSLFWNNTYSNRIQFMKSGSDFLTRAARAGATWVFLSDHDSALAQARAAGSGWQEVGVLNPINGGRAFRHVVVPPPPKAPPLPPLLGPPAPTKLPGPVLPARGAPAAKAAPAPQPARSKAAKASPTSSRERGSDRRGSSGSR